jgi:hypothetical protein
LSSGGRSTSGTASTYAEFTLDDQPAVDDDPGLAWLRAARNDRRGTIALPDDEADSSTGRPSFATRFKTTGRLLVDD